MIKRIITLIIAIVMITSGCFLLAQGQELDVNITSEDSSISIVESIPFEAVSDNFLEFWIQDGATDISVRIDGESILYESIGSNKYSSNVSLLTNEDIINTIVAYKLDKDSTEFEKTILYNLSSLKITYDGKEIYSSTNIKSGSTINVVLQKEKEGQTIKVETIPSWIYIIIFIVLLIALFIMFTKKQKSSYKKENIGGSEELLATKKALLMETLKEIEKKHRSKKISDDTYHKLKDEFKQDAVEAMKHLEELKKVI
ncbi:MAG: hypothetical protein MUO82_01590 [Candidatus Thermoplasmatota archaeon]|nr:hypothetical protein [Candidatus Thermoplasmatota archaeon]